jgi:hypothetical protein
MKFIILGVAVLIGCGSLYWWSLSEGDTPASPTALTQTINQCDLIASKAAAELPEALPFQKLEKAARQSHVLERCMQDRGYQENPAWVADVNKHISDTAHAKNTSEAEAYETLRRQAMLKENVSSLNYWRKRS